jgi:peptidoglycan/xylan/chitin deacetylase (PgdA/CDA1 family)
VLQLLALTVRDQGYWMSLNLETAERIRTDRPAWVPTPTLRASIWFHVVVVAVLAVHPKLWPWLIGALLTNHLLLGGLGMWPRSTLLGPNLSRLPGSGHHGRFIVLTFDDGPDPAITPQVLDLLDRYGAKASFFCIGTRAASCPDLVREIVRRGHSVENHSNSHPVGFACYSIGALRREVMRAQATLTETAGRPPRFLRAPFGLRSPLLDPALSSIPLRYVSWTRRGYDRASRSPEKVLRRLTRGLAAGDILLLHDVAKPCNGAGEPLVLDVLPRLLRHIETAGLRTLSLPLAITAQRTP